MPYEIRYEYLGREQVSYCWADNETEAEEAAIVLETAYSNITNVTIVPIETN